MHNLVFTSITSESFKKIFFSRVITLKEIKELLQKKRTTLIFPVIEFVSSLSFNVRWSTRLTKKFLITISQ